MDDGNRDESELDDRISSIRLKLKQFDLEWSTSSSSSENDEEEPLPPFSPLAINKSASTSFLLSDSVGKPPRPPVLHYSTSLSCLKRPVSASSHQTKAARNLDVTPALKFKPPLPPAMKMPPSSSQSATRYPSEPVVVPRSVPPMKPLDTSAEADPSRSSSLLWKSHNLSKRRATPIRVLSPLRDRKESLSETNKENNPPREVASASTPIAPVTDPFPEMRVMSINGKKYRVQRKLGKGGSSTVWQVFEPTTLEEWAVKVVDLSDADLEVRQAYENEIHLLKRLQYSHRIVKLVDYEKRGDEQFVVMEKGVELGTVLKTCDLRKERNRLVFYWEEMLKAVSVIHKEGIIHSDLKTGNFLLVDGELKLIDFGIARAVPHNRTSVTVPCQMGTLNYMSPEAIQNVKILQFGRLGKVAKLTIKSDVWSLGIILYKLVYGGTPFDHIPNRNVGEKMEAISSDKPINVPEFFEADGEKIEVSSEIRQVIQLCLIKNLAKRPSVDELLEHPLLKKHSILEASCVSSNAEALRAALQNCTPKTKKELKSFFMADKNCI